MASIIRQAFWAVPEHPTSESLIRQKDFPPCLVSRSECEPVVRSAGRANSDESSGPKTALVRRQPDVSKLPLYDYMGCFTAGGEWRPEASAAARRMPATPLGDISPVSCCPEAALPPYTSLLADPPHKSNAALRVVAISDTHEFHTQLRLPPGDVLVHCGDILCSDRFTPRCVSTPALAAFFAWLGAQPFAVKVCIGGNHDAAMERLGHDAVKRMAADAGVVYLQHTMVDVCGVVRILGEPVSTGTSGNSAFQNQATWLSDLPTHVACLTMPSPVSVEGSGHHGGIGQFAATTVERSSLPDPSRVDIHVTHGCVSNLTVAQRVLRVAPALHLCGHEHERHGARFVGAGPIVSLNAAVIDGPTKREYLQPPTVFDFIPRC